MIFGSFFVNDMHVLDSTKMSPDSKINLQHDIYKTFLSILGVYLGDQ